jgi:hypothetical protein
MDKAALHEYRKKLIARLGAATGEFVAACRAVKDPSHPLEPGGWNLHQVAAHVRDVDAQVYGMRIRRTAQESSPLFENFDADEWVKSHYDSSEPLEKILAQFEAGLRELTGWLATLPDETWSRVSRHQVYGEFTFQTWVERALAHIEEHLETVRKV